MKTSQDQPIQENLGGFTETSVPIGEDVGDLDLLLYENPKI